MKNISKVIFITVLIILYSISILLFPPVYSISKVFTNKEQIKEILISSEIYGQLPSTLLPGILDSSDNNSDITKLISQIYNDKQISQEIQNITGNTIDNVYNQLEEGKEDVKLDIDNESIRKIFIVSYLKYLTISEQSEYDAFTIIGCTNNLTKSIVGNCSKELIELNKGIDIYLERFGQIQSQTTLFKNKIFGTNSYELLRVLPYWIAATCSILILTTLLLSTQKVKVIKTISIITLLISTLSHITGYLTIHNLPHIINLLITSFSSEIFNNQELILSVSSELVRKLVEEAMIINSYVIVVSLFIAILSIVIPWVLKQREKADTIN